ncbi:endonuclease domain-containing protein [Rhodohalobacter sp. 8-1]|uniref:endonuclease domain-containing protein n=1 Tax=Rhodohalobacter sp. 8-1 TaxID=3131972 RepID=UPI0030ED88E1
MPKNKPTYFPLHAGANPQLFKFARDLRKRQTDAEKIVWEILRDRRFQNLKFRRQHPIFNFVADFYCHSLKLIVEIDGGYHDLPEQIAYDQERDQYFKEYSYNVIRFLNKDVLFDLRSVRKRLRKYIMVIS